MSEILFISEEKVKDLLNWDATYKVVEVAMQRAWERRVIQNARSFTFTPDESFLLSMPGYLNDENYGALACKLVGGNKSKNSSKGLPSISANIILFDQDTGFLKAVIAGTEITAWRTAAASAVATKHLITAYNKKPLKILAILGAGTQGRIHAIAFHYFFHFDEIRIWNHNYSKAQCLTNELNELHATKIFTAFKSNAECVRGADIVVTATFADKPILEIDWLKPGVHINAVGAGLNHHSELSEAIYLSSDIYIDHLEGAKRELAGLEKLGVEFKGEIGGVIKGDIPVLSNQAVDTITIFQGLGMAVEDCGMARLVYDRHQKHHQQKGEK